MYDVIGISHPLVDEYVEVEDSFLDNHELKKGQFHLVTEEEYKQIQNSLQKKESEKKAGGSVSNVLAGLALLNCKTAEFGCIGKDEAGNFLKQQLEKNGIADFLKTEKLPTGTVLAFITPDTQRTFVVYLGAATLFTHEHIDSEVFKDTKIVHTSGYEFESATIRPAIRKIAAAKENTLLSLDLADPGVVQRNLIELREFIKQHVDIIFANEEEAMEFTGKQPEEAVIELGKIAKIAIVKVGSEGSYICADTGEICRIAPYKVKARDTTGAGDMYAAGMLYGIINNYTLEKAGKIASYAAGKVVEQVGARLEKIDINTIS